MPKPEGEKIHLAIGESLDFSLYLPNIKLISSDLEYDRGLIIELCLIGINLRN